MMKKLKSMKAALEDSGSNESGNSHFEASDCEASEDKEDSDWEEPEVKPHICTSHKPCTLHRSNKWPVKKKQKRKPFKCRLNKKIRKRLLSISDTEDEDDLEKETEVEIDPSANNNEQIHSEGHPDDDTGKEIEVTTLTPEPVSKETRKKCKRKHSDIPNYKDKDKKHKSTKKKRKKGERHVKNSNSQQIVIDDDDDEERQLRERRLRLEKVLRAYYNAERERKAKSNGDVIVSKAKKCGDIIMCDEEGDSYQQLSGKESYASNGDENVIKEVICLISDEECDDDGKQQDPLGSVSVIEITKDLYQNIKRVTEESIKRNQKIDCELEMITENDVPTCAVNDSAIVDVTNDNEDRKELNANEVFIVEVTETPTIAPVTSRGNSEPSTAMNGTTIANDTNENEDPNRVIIVEETEAPTIAPTSSRGTSEPPTALNGTTIADDTNEIEDPNRVIIVEEIDASTMAATSSRGTSEPTDEDIKAAVKRIMAFADLNRTTNKMVVKQVSQMYPDFDLKDKEQLIQNTVKKCL